MATATLSAPEHGQLVVVRSRNWIVTELEPGTRVIEQVQPECGMGA